MNEIEKIGMYSTDEILEFMTEGEGRGFLGRSMFDAMYFKIKNLQSKIDKAIEYCEEVIKEHNNREYNVSTVELALKEHKGNITNILDILKEGE